MVGHNFPGYRQIPFASSAYRETVALREQMLRTPQGLNFDAAELDAERDSYHLVCEHHGQIVACVVLKPLTAEVLKLRQMAVSEAVRSQGVGRGLVRYAEQLARQKGYRQIVLNARASAQGFYRQLGYTPQGEPFDEVCLPHIQMIKQL